MAPLYACFPICLTFFAIGLVGIFAVVLMGMHNEGSNASVEKPPEEPQESDLPRWWVVVLIFAVVLLHFAILLWIWPEL